MPGGKITERSIRAPADPVASPAGPDTARAGSPQAHRPPATRPAALEGLARPPASASPGTSMAAVAVRQAELPLRALPAAMLRTPEGVALTKAVKYGALFQTLVSDTSVSTDQRREYAKRGVQQATAGIEALSGLSKKGGLPNPEALLGDLLHHLAEAAMVGIKAYHRMLNEEWDARTERFGIRSEHATAASVYDGLRSALTEKPFQGAMGELAYYRAALDRFVETCEPSRPNDSMPARLERNLPAVLSARVRYRSALQCLDSLYVALCGFSLRRIAAFMGLPDLAQRVTTLADAMKYRRDEVATAIRRLDAVAMWYPGAEEAPPERLTWRQLAECKALVRAYRDGIDRVGTQLCMDSAARIEAADTSPLWKTLLEVAEVIARYRGWLDELCDSVRGGDPEPAAAPGTSGQAPVLAPETASSMPDPADALAVSDAVDPADAADAAGAAEAAEAVVRTEDRGSPAPVSPLAAAPRPPDTRTAAQKQADGLLRRCPVDSETAARFGGDAVAIADAFGKDTRDIERLMGDRKASAAMVATSMRQEVDGWFERRERLEQVRSRLSAEDPRTGHLTDRLRALDIIDRYVTTWEADAAKCALFPKAKHLERLLEMGEIEHVHAPESLRPSKDKRNRDRVFEIRIQPKRLSSLGVDADGTDADGRRQDGDLAWPLFVHLHLSKPVGADKLHTLPYSDFKAVHLKLAAQKGQGRNWEAMMHAMGHRDAKVERAHVGGELLRRLFALAGCDDASGPEAAGASGAR
ncbi:type III effector protein (hlk2) (plasmid) [Ralstonia pseudosolanacearum]|uniref:Type III effector protein (Hlk2) n=1 Tax=Ralstonia solanacearum TaxID=305 RepID=A0AA92QD61_RALSL|nr:type III secretion system effector XopP [Ralstonia pseudosolanacearum]QOK98940.1 type III effector protein (hlk2) [Ralstonia pseudosolanacearum]